MLIMVLCTHIADDIFLTRLYRCIKTTEVDTLRIVRGVNGPLYTRQVQYFILHYRVSLREHSSN